LGTLGSAEGREGVIPPSTPLGYPGSPVRKAKLLPVTRKIKLLWKRIIVAIIFIPIFLFLIFRGGLFFLALICAIIGVGLTEFYYGVHQDGSRIPLRDIILGLCIPVSVYFQGEAILPFVITLVIFIIFFWELFKLRTHQAQINVALSLGGILYISYLFSYIVILRNTPLLGERLVITVFFATWMGDSGAFTIGRVWGKHRFLSSYSPHKSVEGFLGAIAFSMVAMLVSRIWLSFTLIHTLILGILMGLGGEMGDFFESMLKRGLGIKDFGKLLPGHGGVLDRFDSLFFTVPIFFYYFKYLVKVEGIS